MKQYEKTLKWLFHGYDEISLPDDDIIISKISADSRQVSPNTLFVAVEGLSSDGHDFIFEAIQNGAVAVVVQKPADITSVPVIQCKNTRQILAYLVRRFYDHPDESLMMMGVTGTNGKTTVTYLLESIFNACDKICGLMGTITYRWPGNQKGAGQTTPGSIELFHVLRSMVNDGVEAVAMEVSSHALDQYRISGIQYQACIFTNLTQDHLDYHHDFISYARAKSKLFEQLKPDGIGVINGDDSYTQLMMDACKGRKILYGEYASNLDYRIERESVTPEGTRFYLHHYKDKFLIFTPLLGNFNVFNVAAAFIVATELGMETKDIQEAILNMNRVPGRMESFRSKSGFHVVVDYAHTPDALKNALQTVRLFTERHLITVFGCGGDRDRGKRPLMGQVAAEISDRVIVTSDNPRTENPRDIITDILEGIPASTDIQIIEDREAAICEAIVGAIAGDTIMIAGKGHEDYQILGHKKIHFDDREVVQKYLNE